MKSNKLIPNLVVTILILITASSVHGQSYSITQAFMNGGGGVSTGVKLPNSHYLVNVTIGDPLAGMSQGGAYRLSAGFGSLVGGHSTMTIPVLSSSLQGNDVVVSWSGPAAGWVLEQTQVLRGSSTIWHETTARYQTNATHIFITISKPTENAYFRLRGP